MTGGAEYWKAGQGELKHDVHRSICSLLSTLGMSKTDLKGNNTVAIPARLFKLLIKAVAASGDFDENSYFSEILTFSGQSANQISKRSAHCKVDRARGHFYAAARVKARAGI